jgi:hypothetical protein
VSPTLRPFRPLALLLPVLTALLVALLAACGPTTGGTGTGPTGSLTVFGASAASTCSAVFAPSLDCADISTEPVDPAVLQGTDPVHFVGEAASGPYSLTVQANRAELIARCAGANFEGVWGVLPNGDARFFGYWTARGQLAPVSAQLWVQAVAGRADELQAMVLDVNGQTLFGPVLLRRVATPPLQTPFCS